MFVDSHCHLNHPQLYPNIEGLILRARSQQISTLLSICTSLRELPDLEKISSQFPEVFYTVGVHPDEVKAEGIPSVSDLIHHAQAPKAIGFGETGLDYYHKDNPHALQQESFRHHIEAAIELNLPLVIHSREAESDILSIFKEFPLVKMTAPGVIHCFTGSAEFAQDVLKLGFYISISGIITFKNAATLRSVLETIPLDRILIETDAPYLAPVPYRGKINESAYIVHTAQIIAEIKGVSLAEIAAITRRNFFTLFTKATSPVD